MRMAALFVLTSLMSGCVILPRENDGELKCRYASDMITRQTIEICERKFCRSAASKRFMRCL